MTKANILRVWDQATEDDMRAGVGWYQSAKLVAESMSRHYGVPVCIAAGVLAALSPNNKWARNIADADRVLSAWLAGDDPMGVSVCTYGAMKAKAVAVLRLAEPDDEAVQAVLNGQKIVSFFRNIMGYDDCTIDGHAVNIYRGRRRGLKGEANVNKAEYAKMQRAYRGVAKRVDQPSYVVQAVTWVVWKRLHGIN